MISSSIVWQDPPALVILARADSVKRRAATLNLGISGILKSSVTVPTTTTVLSLLLNTPLVTREYLLSGSEMSDQFAEGDRWAVGPGSDESSEDGLAELRVGSPGKELEELHTKTR